MTKPKNRIKDKYTDFFSEADKTLSSERVMRAKKRAKKTILQIKLADLRNRIGVRQAELKDFTQSNVSRLESRNDMKISTLIDYIHNLGMEIEIKVHPAGNASKKDEILLLKA